MTDTFRKEYRPLDDSEKALMEEIKVTAEKLEGLFNKVLGEGSPSPAGREVALSKTKLEEAVMWAVKGLTK